MLRVFALIITTLLYANCNANKENSVKNNAKEEQLPNIIMLIGDDQGYPYFGFMGADYIHTPNMDEPSLQTLLTGILPIDFHNRNFATMEAAIAKQNIPVDSAQAFKQNFDQRALGFSKFNTLPKMLAEKGYASFQGGKWWEFNYQNGGFTHGMTKGWTEAEQKRPGWFYKHMGGEGMDLARVTNQPAYDFLDDTKGKPFFMWFAPSLPHYPFDAPEKYYQLYEDKDMSESAKQYYANCTTLRKNIGMTLIALIMEAIKAKGLFTICLFGHPLFLLGRTN